MKTEKIKNKEGEILKTADGIELKNHTFEVGDEFIPQHNKVYEYENKTSEGKKITSYKILAEVRDKDSNKYENDVSDDNAIFVSLTPTQAKKVKKVLASGNDINQDIWKAYHYTNDFGDQIGIGMRKELKKPRSFEEVDKEE